MRLPLIGLLFLSFVACKRNTSSLRNHENFSGVVYGEDSRKNIGSLSSEAPPTLQSAATVLILRNDEVQRTPYTLLQSMPLLCKDEKFLTESVRGFCSGVLIAPDRVLTAGHCFRHLKECQESSFVFGFTAEKATHKMIPAEIYHCAELLEHKHTKAKSLWSEDYAVVRLDRPVRGVLPVKIADKENLPRAGDIVVSLSHPLGLPLKQDVARVLPQEATSHFIRVGVDTFSTSSGSPLFNQRGEVVGILSEGADDLIPEELSQARRRKNTCLRFQRCNESTPTASCPGELFFKAWLVP